MKSRVHPRYKTKYRVTNWPEYERSLVRRGDVTIWLTPEAVAAWRPTPNGTRGGQRRYSDLAIETSLTLRLVFHLPLRQAEGFLAAPVIGVGAVTYVPAGVAAARAFAVRRIGPSALLLIATTTYTACPNLAQRTPGLLRVYRHAYYTLRSSEHLAKLLRSATRFWGPKNPPSWP
ncbi:MAG: hypothetical protein GY711_20705 [bacterium]|nr:hypothetical protein [bacterium]